ncbi:hypothetical protein BDR26DRAFT_858819 [Obelidium mucronatum]|nr:hypothetical protein BDR26DRAFT_858819 [Obelidium mucronatum]
MPLLTLTREAVALLPDPAPEALAARQVAADLAPSDAGADADSPDGDAVVFQIPFTGEIFTAYDDFYARIMFYRRRIFTCEETGKSRMTFQAALQSEKLAREKAKNRFPEPWRKPALEFIQFNRSMINSLVDKLNDHLKERLFINELVTVGSKYYKGAYVKVLAAVGPRGVILSGEGAAASEQDPATPSYTSPHSEILPTQIHYIVHVCDEFGDLVLDEGCDLETTIANGIQRFTVKATECKRSRHTFNKINFRWFINETAERGDSPFAPWIVKKSLVKKYKLLTEMPVVKRVRKPVSFTAKGKPRFPMDDLELLEIAPRDTEPTPPIPSRDFGTIQPELIPALVQSWSFLGIFGKPLRLLPFTFDDYIKALEAPKSVLLHETMASLMNQVCYTRLQTLNQAHSNGGRLVGAALTSAIAAAAATAGPQNTPSTETHDIKMQDAQAQIELPSAIGEGTPAAEYYRLFQSKFNEQLTDFERLAVDQWYKWSIGRWAHPVNDVVRPPGSLRRSGAASKSLSSAPVEYTVAGRLRAWEVAFLGFVRDCVEESEFDGKWRVLAVMIGAVADDGGVSADCSAGEYEGNGNSEEQVREENNDDDEKQHQNKVEGGGENGVVEAAAPAVEDNAVADDVEMKEGEDVQGKEPVVVEKRARESSMVPSEDSDSLAEDLAGRRSSRRKKRKVDSYAVAENGAGGDEDSRDGSFELGSDEETVTHKRTTRRQWQHQHEEQVPVQPRTSGRNTRAAMAATQHALALTLTGTTTDGPSSPLSVLSSSSVGATPSEATKDEPEAAPAVTKPKSHKYNPYKQPKAAAAATAASASTSATTEKKVTDGSISEMEYLLSATSRGFTTLSASDRLSLIKILSEKWATQSVSIRAFSETMHDKIADVKKYKRESLGKEQRAMYLARYELDEKLKARGIQENDVDSSSAPAEDQAADDVDAKDDEAEDEPDADESNVSVSALRQRKIRKEAAKKKEREKALRLEQSRLKVEKKVKEKEDQELLEEVKKVQEMERVFYQKQFDHDVENTMGAGVSRMAPLGMDRNYNKYWWFDIYHGLIAPKKFPCEVDHYALSPFRETGFAAGILLVEEIGGGEYELLEQGIVPAKTWSYLATPQDVQKLVSWLDARGIREFALLDGLKKNKEILESGMTKRLEFLAAEALKVEMNKKEDVVEQKRRRNGQSECKNLPSFLAYRNLWCK